MANIPREKGTKAESAVVDWWHAQGERQVERHSLHGTHDLGDINTGLHLVQSVKFVGKGKRLELSVWLNELQTMRTNVADRHPELDYPAGLLTIRRPLYPRVDDWYAVMRMGDWWMTFQELLT